jgi:hypothetical protein
MKKSKHTKHKHTKHKHTKHTKKHSRYGKKTRKYRGGSLFFKDTYQPPTALPGPFIGSPWKGSVSDWPGVNGVGGDKNYYSLNTHHYDPQTEGVKLNSGGSQYGGSRRRGGGAIQDVQNIGRNAVYQAQSLYNTLQGQQPPINPLPYKGQLSH